MSTQLPPLRLTTHHSLTSRLVLSTLLGRAVHISQIRPSSPTNPGLAPHEISFLRLLESLTNGSHIEISYTGTVLLYKPGLMTGSVVGHGASANGIIRHEIAGNNKRGLSYFLLPLCLLAPFSKGKVNVLFAGPGVITSCVEKYGDVSVDTVRTAILPYFAKFGIERDVEIRVLRRSNACGSVRGHSGAGEVQVVIGQQIRLPKTLHLMRSGRVNRVRGVAYATGVSAGNNARMIEKARSVLNELVGDVYVFSDVGSAALVDVTEKGNNVKKKVGLGFGLSLVAETTGGGFYSADAASPEDGGEAPEEVGLRCAYLLLDSIQRGGCVPVEAAPAVATLMAMGSEDVGRLQLGREVLASENMVQLARDLSAFGAAGWGIRDANGEKDEGQLVVSIVGRGIGNVGRKIG